jgi:hypothetical protein
MTEAGDACCRRLVQRPHIEGNDHDENGVAAEP